MKKLLITSMAAVAVSICAKADFTANESFEFKKNAQGENVPLTEEGPFFDVDETTGKYIYGLDWTSEATPEDGIFTVTNISKITSEEAPYPTDRPLTGENLKALAIDTEKSLIRRVIPGASSTTLEGASLIESEGGAPIFFDSIVQFTASETAPETTGAKLVAWLYKTEDLADGEKGLFGETDPISKLVITALYDDTKNLFKTNFLTDVTIQPESWHRLTIKSFVQDEVLQFEVRVDGDIVKVNGEEVPFISLDELETQDKTLKGVAFEGKGVVDDLVFTTTDPFAGGGGEEPEPEPEAEKFTLKFTIDADAEAEAAVLLVVADETDNEANEDGNFILGVDVSSVVAKIYCVPGYKVTGATASTEEDEEGVWILPVDVTSAVAGGEITCNVAVVADSGSGDEPGTDPETPTVDPTSDTLSAVVAGAADANPGDIAAQVTISISDADTAAGVTDVYFKKTAVYDQAISKWVVTVALDETVVQPSADEALENVAAALTGDETTVSITYTGKAIKPGLYYGLAAAGDLTALETAVPANFERAMAFGVELSAEKPEGNAGFFKVVISATNPNSVQE